jgi:hypothetical protein
LRAFAISVTPASRQTNRSATEILELLSTAKIP